MHPTRTLAANTLPEVWGEPQKITDGSYGYKNMLIRGVIKN